MLEERLERIWIVATLHLRSPTVILLFILHSSLTRPTARAAMREYAICLIVPRHVTLRHIRLADGCSSITVNVNARQQEKQKNWNPIHLS
jgi:hypothetical protein